MKPILSLSTSWCSSRHTDGYAMLQEMAGLGFTHVELSHGIRITLVPGILKALEEGVVKVSSCHNFCPLPTGVMQAAPNLFEPSALGEEEHDQWLRQTKRSIDFAAQVRARVLVMHLGSTKFFWFNPGHRLHAYAERKGEANLLEDARYRAMRDKALAKLLKRMPPYWQRVKDSIEEVRLFAAERGVAMGFENREKFEELPLDADFESLFNSIPDPHTAGYWHDTGHAHLKEQMALINHRAQLETHANRLLGFHLHDVSAEGNDHQPIGSGRVDFEMVSSFWKPHHLLVLEFSPRIPEGRVRSSKERVEELVAKRFGG